MLALAKHAQRTQQRVCNIFVISHEKKGGMKSIFAWR